MAERPYKGLMPYDAADAPFFFGREAETEIISANLMASRLTLLYGSSGVGKTSVLRAGVVRHLRALAAQNLLEHGNPEFAIIFFNDWRDDPITALMDAVEKEVSSLLPGQEADKAQEGKGSLVDILRFYSEQIDGDLLIILDQFEEYFLYHSQEDGEGTFAVEFPRAVNRPDLRVSFLISLREDALAKLDRFKGRIPSLFDNYLRIDHLDRSAARAAIEKPIIEYNRLQKKGEEASIEPELVETILDQLKTGQVMLGAAGRGVVEGADESQIETPYLQLVMTRLWEEEIRTSGAPGLRLATLESLGGAERIVRTHLDTTMSALPPEEQDIAARIFRYVVTPSWTKIAHAAADLAEYAHVSPTKLEPILEKLSGTGVRILRPVAPPLDQPGLPRYEIFHDVLAGAIADWRTRYLRAQELAESEKILIGERAESDRKLAEARHRAHKLRLGVIGLSLMVLLMIGLVVFAFQQRSTAQRAQSEAISQRVSAEKSKAEAISQKVVAEKAKSEAVVQRDVAEKAQSEAIAQRNIAEKARMETEAQRKIAVAREASANALNNLEANPELSLLLSLYAVSSTASHGLPVPREAEEALHRAIQSSRLQLTLSMNRGENCYRVAFSPDGKRLATGGRGIPPGILWDAFTGKKLHTIGRHLNNYSSIAFSPDGRRLATAGGYSVVFVRDAKTTKELIRMTGHSGIVNQVAFSPEGKWIATASDDKTAKIWDAATGKELLTFSGHSKGVSGLAFNADGRRLATVSDDKSVRVWDAVTGKELFTLSGHDGKVSGLTFSPDGKRLATANDDGTSKVWDALSGKLLMTLQRKGESINAIAFDPTGKRLVTGHDDGLARVWDAITGQVLFNLSGNAGPVWGVAFSPDGTRVATANGDGTAKVWDVSPAGGSEGPTLLPPGGPVRDVAYSADGKRLATAGGDGKVRLWDASSGKMLLTLSDQGDRVFRVAFSPDGRHLAAATQDGTVKVWEEATGKVLLTLPMEGNPSSGSAKTSDSTSNNLSFSPDGNRLATGGYDGKVRIWDAITGKLLITFSGPAGPTYSLAFSPDGTLIATGSSRSMQLWNASTGKVLRILPGQAGPTYSVAFSPDGKLLAAGRMDKTVKVWEAATGDFLLTLTGHKGIIYSVAFSHDGKHLAATGADGMVKVWDVSIEKIIARSPLTLFGHYGPIHKMAFSPDGRRLATAGEDGTSRVYALPIEDLVAIAKSRLTRKFTREECRRYLPMEEECSSFP
jgi:WD40 repeat protein